ncbi:hypothetical protein [Rhizobium halophilum]|uniref:hypothetical protein n=1 Tax=Rhizobium halophilum TaxID=2846852 RepID=UPI001EFDAD87|nr:hypothetical protein [Rhizobium halophilum]MCF6371044.1 hypothetical protein [Rhizobium halophilum]
MTERLDMIRAMKRIELARLHAGELNRALFPDDRHDDEIPGAEKAEMQMTVSELVAQHRAEVSAWEQENG